MKLLYFFGIIIIIIASFSMVLFSIRYPVEDTVDQETGRNISIKNREVTTSNGPKKSFDIDLPVESYDGEIYIPNDAIPKLNSWFSSVYFRQGSKPLFVSPYALKFEKDGFSFNLPEIGYELNTVFGSYDNEVKVSFGNNFITTVESHDDLRTKFYLNNIGTVTTVRGTPVIYFSPEEEGEMTISAAQIKEVKDNYIQLGDSYGLYFDNVTEVDAQNRRVTFKVSESSHIRFIIFPGNELFSDDIQDLIIPDISQTQVQTYVQERMVGTDIIYETEDEEDVLIGSREKLENKDILFEYQTIKGPLYVYQGTDLSFERDLIEPRTEIDPENFTEAQRSVLRENLADDIQNPQYPADTYFGGKALSRMAYLIEIADAFGWEKERDEALESLTRQLEKWLTPKNNPNEPFNFVYNQDLGIVVGKEPSFGSNEGNDHHFHYAYFIYAASVVGQYDDDFVDEHADMVEVLIDSFATKHRNHQDFSYMRVFDYFDLHSWASGKALFEDGNNQESSSEAVNAWYALYRWANLRNDKDEMERAKWLYSQEIHSARDYWLNPQHLEDTIYEPPLVSMVWGGKLDYATWFSDAPEAKFMIQMLPMQLNADYLRDDPELVQKHVDYLDKELPNGYSVYKDYMYMYESIVRPNQALESLEDLDDDELDDGNSRTAALFWIYESLNQ